MYAFRKPFTVATFEGLQFLNIDYKILLVIAQVLGYASSKFIGIRVISGLNPVRRTAYLILFILLAELALVLFALTPPPYNIFFLFLNGLPLGLIWGIVFSYLEGRKSTDLLGVVLCSSFIVSSGVVKSVGLFVMKQWEVTELWMPSVTGLFFVLPLCFFAWMLHNLSPPDYQDIQLKSERPQMSAQDRKQLIQTFFFPLSIIVFFYTFLTAFRDLRDNFARELWDSIGFRGDVSVYSTSEIIVAGTVLGILGLIFFLKNNFKALVTYHILFLFGCLLLGSTTLLFQMNLLDPFVWMVATGFGLYISYVPFNGMFFDRLIAAFKLKGNSGFLIYIADAFGYVGSVLVLLYRNFGQPNLSWLQFFIIGTYVIAGLGLLITLFSYLSLRKKHNSQLIQP